MLRELDADESARRTRWLCGDSWPPTEGHTGFDRIAGWPAAAWILNAVYERDDIPAGLTHQDLRQSSIDAGIQSPTMINGVNLDEVAVTTGMTLGFAERPPMPWRRLSWADLGGRDGFGSWAVDGEWPQLRYRAHGDWGDPAVMPADSWPRLGPDGHSSWPVNLLPPTEGSLDEASLLALITVLARHTTDENVRECLFYYGSVPFMVQGATVYSGDLFDLLPLIRSQRGTRLTPSNFWPSDHSWFVYTDYDLWATRVSGSQALIDALTEDGELDTIRCR